MSNLNELKKHVFFEFLNLAGRVYIIVKYSQKVILGRRGFTDQEKANGIILVFNSTMNFIWDDEGIKTSLIFNNSPVKCFIPAEDIILIYSPDLDAQFGIQLTDRINKPYEDKPEKQKRKVISDEEQTKIIKVDFNKKRTIDG